MSFKEQLKKIEKNVKKEISIYQAVLGDKRTPLLGKFFLGLAVGYFFSPIDFIPDFIPILGHLDDLIIVPALLFIALKLIPKEIVEEHKRRAESQN